MAAPGPPGRPRRLAPYVLGASVPLGWLIAHWDAPLVEDALFWFVPTSLQQVEVGTVLAAEGPLPAAVMGEGLLVPPQWDAGLPDYGHPPLWYWWLALFLRFGANLHAVRAACVVPAIAMGLGFVALAERQGRAWAGLAVWAIPGVLAQLLRPELDLPLLAVLPWALLALRRDAWGPFAGLAALATWLKEPGVLLVVPALVHALRRRTFAWQALVPLLALGAWAGVHGGLAPILQRPTSWGQLGENLLGVGRFVGTDQGRAVLLLGVGGILAAPVEASLILAFCVFFAYVRYYATAGTQDAYTHLRYLLPAVSLYVVTAAGRGGWPLAFVQLWWLHRVHPNGPEASMAGVDAAYAERAALAGIEPGRTVWVGTYLAAGLGRAWAGQPGLAEARMYTFGTTPEDLAIGDLLVVSPYGEPATRLERALVLELAGAWTVGEVEVRVERVTGRNPSGWVPAAAAPR